LIITQRWFKCVVFCSKSILNGRMLCHSLVWQELLL